MSGTFPRSPQNFFSLDVTEAKKFIPQRTPSGLANLAFDCCKDEPTERPTFRQVIKRLNDIRNAYQLAGCSSGNLLKNTAFPTKTKADAVVVLPPTSPNRADFDCEDEKVWKKATGSKITARCSFLELNELGIRFENELEIEEVLIQRFGLQGGIGSWYVISSISSRTKGCY